MENSNIKRYSMGIPILALLLFLSSIVGIIGASFRYNAAVNESGGVNTTSSTEAGLIIRIVVAAFLTVLFFLVMLFGFMEVGEPKNYQAKFLTNKFESRLEELASNLESWELIFLMSNYLTLPIGIAVTLIDSNSGYLWMSFASIAAVTWSYNYRMGTRTAIKQILPRHHEISLNSLSQAVSRDQNRVKKTILYLISYEDYPATYDFATQIITYHGSDSIAQGTGNNPLESDVIVAERPSSQTTQSQGKNPKPKLKPCPFCDTMPIDVRAKFCHDCGASIVAAK